MKNLATVLLIAIAGLLLGCSNKPEEATAARNPPAAASREVVVYTSLDRQFSEPIFKVFEERTGITVKPVFDSEAVKNVGLVNRLLSERNRPTCDVFWNNEVVRSIQLKREGITQPYQSPSAADIPAHFKDAEHHWAGFAARARVFMMNTEKMGDPAADPKLMEDMADPKWKGTYAFAKPLFGTTNTHAALIHSMIGAEAAEAFWKNVLDTGVMLAGNAQSRDAAASGELAWCATDTDDAYGAMKDGKPVRMVYNTAVPGHPGAFLLPNSVVLIAGAPHPEEGKALIDFLLSREVEEMLAKSRGAQIPLRDGVPGPDGLPKLAQADMLAVEWEKIADALADSNAILQRLVDAR